MASAAAGFLCSTAPSPVSSSRLPFPSKPHIRAFLPQRANPRSTKAPRLAIAFGERISPKCRTRLVAAALLKDSSNPETTPRLEDSPSSAEEEFGLKNSDFKDITTDIKLPRRSLLVQFTCNSCGERTERTINRVAYDRGTIFVQCAGCLQHHKLVDNLGLVVEYDLREDRD